MELIRGSYNITPKHHGCVATIGNFDGLHLGHQQVLQHLTEQAKLLNLPSLLMSFEPLALEYFLTDQAPARLMRLREKLMVLQAYAIDRVLCLKFNKHLANLSAADFVKTILVDQLGVRYLIVGDDFRFGKDRQGDFNLLKKLGAHYHFQVANTETVLLNNERVGSSRVRAALKAGDFNLAQQLLGRPYTMSGHVIHGDKRGRQLGFPTANLLVNRVVAPLAGVYAVKVQGLANEAWPGVANIGRRPTVDGHKHLLEINLLNFQQTIYGKFLQVEFIQKIRDEQRFAAIDLLTQQIQQDVATANVIFGLTQIP